MLRFVLDDPEGLFVKLASPRGSPETLDGLLQNLGMDVPSVGVAAARAVVPRQYGSGELPLLPPLKEASFYWNSDGQRYWGNVHLKVDESFLSVDAAVERMQAALRESGGIPANQAVLIVYDREPFFRVSVWCPPTLEIAYGSGGTARRSVTNVEHLQTDMERFLAVVEKCVNACYDGPTPDVDYRVYAT